MSIKYREHLSHIIAHCYSITKSCYLSITTPYGFDLEITSYDTVGRIQFDSCSNIYCLVTGYSSSHFDFYIDLYKDRFAICKFGKCDWVIEVDDFTPFYPLTEESFFQMQLLFDLKDLTLDECQAIINLCVQIPCYEDFI